MLSVFAARPYGPLRDMEMMARLCLIISSIASGVAGAEYNGSESDFLPWAKVETTRSRGASKGNPLLGIPDEDDE